MVDRPNEWARWWVWMWAIIVAVLLPLALLIPFYRWSVVAAAMFGVPELIAVLRRRVAYPPLTQVVHHYLWRWVVISGIWAFGAAIYASWFLTDPPLGWIAFGAGVFGWLTDHFNDTFESARKWPDPPTKTS